MSSKLFKVFTILVITCFIPNISFSGDCSEKSIRESALSYVQKINKAING